MQKAIVNYAMPFADYQAAPGINASALKQAKSMLHLKEAIASKLSDTDAMRLGRLIHEAVLMPKFVWTGAVYPGPVRYGAKYDKFVADNQGKTIITKGELATITGINNSIQVHPVARQFLLGLQPEVSIFWETKRYGQAKARLDGIQHETLVEIKTTSRDIDLFAIERMAYQSKWHIQLGWYNEALRKAKNKIKQTILIVIETEPPYDIIVIKPTRLFLEEGRKAAIKIASQYKRAVERNEFPGISDRIETISLPGYAVSGTSLKIVGESYAL